MSRSNRSRVAVLSDIHAHAAPFRDALTAARREGFDDLLILGDLLTYGPDPAAVLDLAAEAVERDGAILVLGNHEQLYLDLEAGRVSYAGGLPDWIRESVDWTRQTMGRPLSDLGLPWRRSWSRGALFAAHANPFAYGDWTYLSSDETRERAAVTLAKAGFAQGVFGHVHRPNSRAPRQARAGVAVVGSLGQPRDGRPGVSQWAMLELAGDACDVSTRPVACDWASHMAAIRRTSMSESTKDRLCGFFQ